MIFITTPTTLNIISQSLKEQKNVNYHQNCLPKMQPKMIQTLAWVQPILRSMMLDQSVKKFRESKHASEIIHISLKPKGTYPDNNKKDIENQGKEPNSSFYSVCFNE